VVSLIYNSVHIEKNTKKRLISGWVGTVRPLRQSALRHFQMPTVGPPVSHLEQGTPARAYSLVWFDVGIRC
jgi:hypothetical protein